MISLYDFIKYLSCFEIPIIQNMFLKVNSSVCDDFPLIFIKLSQKLTSISHFKKSTFKAFENQVLECLRLFSYNFTQLCVVFIESFYVLAMSLNTFSLYAPQKINISRLKQYMWSPVSRFGRWFPGDFMKLLHFFTKSLVKSSFFCFRLSKLQRMYSEYIWTYSLN